VDVTGIRPAYSASLRGTCPICLRTIEVPSGSDAVTCPYCGTTLRPQYRVMHQEIPVSFVIDVRDFLLPLLPAVATGLFVSRTTRPIKRYVRERRKVGEALVAKTVEIMPKEYRRPLILGSAGVAYFSSLVMLFISKAVRGA